MGIFRRKDKQSQTNTAASAEETSVDPATDEPVEVDEAGDDGSTAKAEDADSGADADVAADAGSKEEPAPAAPRLNSRDVDRSNGPFDRSEVDDLDGRIDFGALAIVPIEGMELRLDVDEAGEEITGLTAIIGESACQIQAFAAPKSSGVWDGIRGEIHDNLLNSGGTAEEKTGDLGRELHVRMPATGPDGRTTFSPATFVGVDGPRWFLRAVMSGKAAMDDEAFALMLSFVKNIVVTRGGEPRAPREMLPMRLPENTEPMVDDDEAGVPNPFARGPEITEVR